MADITMCKGEGCLQKTDCYRYTARPGILQSYFWVPPMFGERDCPEFETNGSRERQKREGKLARPSCGRDHPLIHTPREQQ